MARFRFATQFSQTLSAPYAGVIHPKGSNILIRAFKSQYNLKPYHYRESYWLSIVCSVIVLPIAYYLCSFVFMAFEIESNVPLRQYDQVTVFACLTICLITISLCLYIGWVLSSTLFYGRKFRKGDITKAELTDITYKGHYPERWQK